MKRAKERREKLFDSFFPNFFFEFLAVARCGERMRGDNTSPSSSLELSSSSTGLRARGRKRERNEWELDVDEGVFEEFESEGKGKGVRVRTEIESGRNVMFYEGELLNESDALEREERYRERGDRMSYTFWFQTPLRTGRKREWLCVDATHSQHRSRLINHSKRKPNLRPQLHEIDGQWRIVFRSSRTIRKGDELLFDYGERRPEVLKAHPWLLK